MFRLLLTFCAHARTREISKKEDDGLKKKWREKSERGKNSNETEKKKKKERNERKSAYKKEDEVIKSQVNK